LARFSVFTITWLQTACHHPTASTLARAASRELNFIAFQQDSQAIRRLSEGL